MSTKTLVAVLIALSALLLPIGGWALNKISDSTARISVLEEAKGTIKEQLDKIDTKLDQVLEEQRQVRADLRRSTVVPYPSPAPRGSNVLHAP